MYLPDRERDDVPTLRATGWAFRSYVLGGLAFAFAFLAGGHASVPRRFAVHMPEWIPYDRVGSIGAVLVIAAMLVFTVRIIAGLTRPLAPCGCCAPCSLALR